MYLSLIITTLAATANAVTTTQSLSSTTSAPAVSQCTRNTCYNYFEEVVLVEPTFCEYWENDAHPDLEPYLYAACTATNSAAVSARITSACECFGYKATATATRASATGSALKTTSSMSSASTAKSTSDSSKSSSASLSSSSLAKSSSGFSNSTSSTFKTTTSSPKMSSSSSIKLSSGSHNTTSTATPKSIM